MNREEAIDIIRKNIPHLGIGAAEMTEALNELFPELRESKDERIRKLLVWQVYRNIEDETNDLAQSVYDGIKGHDPDLEESIEDWKKCLAWLEKQKENPKSVDSISSDCTSDAKCEDRHNKPGDFIFELRQIISRHWWADEHSDRIEDEEGMAKEILELCEKQKEQKPVVTHGETYHVDTLGTQQVIAGKMQQKPAWSEEDEKVYGKALDALYYKDCNDKDDVLSALKDLCDLISRKRKVIPPYSRWKPTDEQMNCLCAAVDAAIRKHNESVSGYEPARILKSLYEQLKKL